MELKDRKRIVNGKLPKFDPGKADWGNIATSALGTGTAIYDAHQYNTTSDDMMYEAGTDNANIGGIGYTQYNDVNRDKIMNDVSAQNKRSTLTTTLSGVGTGAAIGSIIPGVGTAVGAGIGALVGGLGGFIGGWFGGKSRKRKAREQAALAQQKIDNYNEMNRSDALTASLQQKQAEKYGDSRSQLLFGADKGKPKGLNPDLFLPTEKLVHTSAGKVEGVQNSWTRQGEGIWNDQTEDAHLVDEGPNDTAPSNLKPNERVFGATKNPLTGNKFEDDARPLIAAKEALNKLRPKGKGWLSDQTQKTYAIATKDLNEQLVQGLNDLGTIQDITMARQKYNCGKPKFDLGLSWWGNAIPSLMGATASLGQYFGAKADKPYKPDTYVQNKYQNKALGTLAGLRIDPYGTMQQLREAEARSNYAVNASGGLSTAQKNLARIASLNGTQQQIGNMLNSIQAQNNSYRQAYANAMLQTGESEAQRRQQSKQWDLDYYSKAHAARQQMMQMGMRNFLDYVNQYSANEFKRKSAIANYDLYAQQVENETAKLDAQLKGQEKSQPVVVNNWTGGVPYVLAPEILDKIPGAIQNPKQAPQFTPGPRNWQLPKYDWNDMMKKYG